MYEMTEQLLDDETKSKDYTVVMGDFNAVVREGKEDGYVAHYGLGCCNDCGQMLADFCKRRQMYIAKTWFTRDRRRQYTWMKPGDTGRYQIDYILTKFKHWNSVCNAKACPGADTDCGVVARLRVKLKVLKATVRKHWLLARMKDEGTAMNYRCEIDTAVVTEKQESADVNGRWEHLMSTVIKAAELTLGHKTRQEVQKPWVTDEMIDMMEERWK